MDTQVREVGPFERSLTVHLDERELEAAKDRAARKLSRSLKIKGFRPGKAPRRVVEATVGPDALRSEAIEEALPSVLGSALEEAELVPAVPPRVEEMRDADGGVEVEVKVTLWPRLAELPAYRDRRVRVDAVQVTEAEVSSRVDRLREQFAELESAPRAAQPGDYVSLDLSATHHGRPVEDASARDLLYEVGSQSFIAGLDEQLAGAATGQIVQWNAPLPEGFGELGGKEVTLRALVKEVKRKKLPEATDEWVSEVSEFETVDELRGALRESLADLKHASVRSGFPLRVLDDLLGEVDVSVPEALVGAEMERLLERFLRRLEGQGADLQGYLQAAGLDQPAFLDQLRREAERSLRTDILLDAVASAEGLKVGPDEVEEAVATLARGAGQEVAAFRRTLQRSGQEVALVSDILRQKALDLLVEAAVAVDDDGNLVDLQSVASAADTSERDESHPSAEEKRE